jgi:hypothetical protein
VTERNFSLVNNSYINWRHIDTTISVETTGLPKRAVLKSLLAVDGKPKEPCQLKELLVVIAVDNYIITVDQKLGVPDSITRGSEDQRFDCESTPVPH